MALFSKTELEDLAQVTVGSIKQATFDLIASYAEALVQQAYGPVSIYGTDPLDPKDAAPIVKGTAMASAARGVLHPDQVERSRTTGARAASFDAVAMTLTDAERAAVATAAGSSTNSTARSVSMWPDDSSVAVDWRDIPGGYV